MGDPGKPLDLRDFSDEVARQAGLTPDQLARHKGTGVPDELLKRAQPDALILPDRTIEAAPEALQVLYDSYKDMLRDFTVFPKIEPINGRLTYTDILGEPQPIPTWEEIQQCVERQEGAIIEKMNQGFRTLVLVPFGMETRELVHACLELADANARAGKLRSLDGSEVFANGVHLQDTFGLMSMTDQEQFVYSFSGGTPFGAAHSKESALSNDHLVGWEVQLARDSDVMGSLLTTDGDEGLKEIPEELTLGEIQDFYSENLISGERFMSIDDYWIIAFMQQRRMPSEIEQGRRFVLASCMRSPGGRVPVTGITARVSKRFNYHVTSIGQNEQFPAGWEVPTVVPIGRLSGL